MLEYVNTSWWLSPLSITLIIITSFVFVVGIPLLRLPTKYIPTFVDRLYKFSKLSSVKKGNLLDRFFGLVEIPKRYFAHFYIFGSAYALLVAFFLVRAYVWRIPSPDWLIEFLNWVASENRNAPVSEIAVSSCMVLIICQVLRRLYESLYISVFSAGRINVVHYVLGIIFYFSVSTSLLVEAPGFVVRGSSLKQHLDIFDMKWYTILGILLYIWACQIQYRCGIILANLRKNKKGDVVTRQHKIPLGYWFDHVSCPHFMAEILIYTAMNITLGLQNKFFWLLLLFVVVNQVLLALFVHQWYITTFKNYPKQRKAVIPLLL